MSGSDLRAALDAAVRAAAHVEALQQLLDEELGVSGARRRWSNSRPKADFISTRSVSIWGRIQIGDLAPLKSPQRHAAAVARWGANRA